jgi:hypothetical protein
VRPFRFAVPLSGARDGEQWPAPAGRIDAARLSGLTAAEVAEVAETPLALVGTVNQICESLEARRDEFGISYWVAHEANIEEFASFVAAMTGK